MDDMLKKTVILQVVDEHLVFVICGGQRFLLHSGLALGVDNI